MHTIQFGVVSISLHALTGNISILKWATLYFQICVVERAVEQPCLFTSTSHIKKHMLQSFLTEGFTTANSTYMEEPLQPIKYKSVVEYHEWWKLNRENKPCGCMPFILMLTIGGESQLSADHRGILIVPGIITHSSISSIDTHLHPTPA